ncbi:hypothetical protein UG55_101639 [Frankia sp. EI5c]|uniref:hypothetical protein n=1 Tax=Frankia sp. EI5c TaxID=683316 RepID=UPI0007C296A3|nr:hypothetical protein [Frankia sp. EI5c]OAA26375.1 hypothetical protein UG55_101639 [Frankia sp. EI5c]
MSRPSTATTPRDDHTEPPRRGPAPEPHEITIFVGRTDGAAITVAAATRAPDHARAQSVQVAPSTPAPHPDEPGLAEIAPEGGLVVRLRITPNGPGPAASTDLEIDEVRRIVDHLLTLESARRPGSEQAGTTASPPAEPGARVTVVTAEGTTAGGLRHALASVPAEARLRDFTSDAEVVLVFDQARRPH